MTVLSLIIVLSIVGAALFTAHKTKVLHLWTRVFVDMVAFALVLVWICQTFGITNKHILLRVDTFPTAGFVSFL